MTNIKYIDFQSFLREKMKDVTIHKKATSIALGIAVSRMLSIPSVAVDSSAVSYDTMVGNVASEYIYEFNENIVIDVDLAKETAKCFWMIRYTSAHPDMNTYVCPTDNFDFMLKINNATRFINLDTYKFCNCNSEVVTVIVNRINRLLKDKEAT